MLSDYGALKFRPQSAISTGHGALRRVPFRNEGEMMDLGANGNMSSSALQISTLNELLVGEPVKLVQHEEVPQSSEPATPADYCL